MKKILLLLTIAIYSCSKDIEGNIIPSNDVYVKYKANGIQQQFNGNAAAPDAEGVIVFKTIHSNNTSYFLQAQKGANNAMEIGIDTDTLQPGNYIGEPVFTFVLINGTQFSSLNNNQILNVHIDQHQSSLLNGTFSGKLYSYNQSTFHITDSISITEGEFKNVRVIY